jgi:hypothetical protein
MTTRTVTLVALAWALGGCAESGPGLSAPEDTPISAAISAQALGTAALGGGLIAGAQPVNIQTDTPIKLSVNTGGISTPYDGETNYGIDTTNLHCVETNNPPGPNHQDLVPYRAYNYVPNSSSAGNGTLGFEVDRTKQTSSKHFVNVSWVEAADGIRVRANLGGGLTVDSLVFGGTTRYIFSGGRLAIHKLTANKAPTLTCDNNTNVMVDLTR